MANDKKKPSIASQGAVMRRVLRYIGPHVSLVVLSLVLCLISVALTLYVPILVGRAVDCIVGPNAVDFAALKPILLADGLVDERGLLAARHGLQAEHRIRPLGDEVGDQQRERRDEHDQQRDRRA